MTGYVGVLDTSVYQMATGRQSGPTGDTSATITLGAHNLDLARAARLGVRGIFHRASNGMAVDPSYRPVADAAKLNGLHFAGYSYIRPNEAGTAADHADLFLTALLGGPTPTLPAMADVEDFHGIDAWRGNRYADWLHLWLERIEDATGRRPIIYSYRWLWTSLLGHRAGEFAATYEGVIAAYPHQPNAATQQHLWPRPPVDAQKWWEWATSSVPMGDGSLDAGYPTGPDPLPGWNEWSMWQIGSFGRARDYGFDAASNIDINVVPADVWSRWTESASVPVPEPPPPVVVPPLPTPAPTPPLEVPVAETLYPVGYGTTLVTLDKCLAEAAAHHHPEYVRRLRAWLIAQDGRIGIGDAWRATGTQPDRPGFAPEGKSFHQDQKWSDGFVGGAAVDLVARNGTGRHRSPRWSEVPAQGSKDAVKWGLHCNIDSEAWHMQPVEVDGHASWLAAGRPSPKRGYPLPTVEAPAPAPKPAPTPDRYVTAEALELVPNANPQSGWPVLLIQIGLNAYRFQHGQDQLVTDGVYGIRTVAAVMEFQTAKGLTPDGVIGPKTWTSFLTGKVWS